MADLKEKSIGLLGIATVNFTAGSTGATTLYTVPTGKTCVVTKVVVVAGADAGTTAITIGRSTALTDFLNTQTLTGINAAGDVAILQPVPNATTVLSKSYAAGVIIQVNVTTADGGAGNLFKVFGFLY